MKISFHKSLGNLTPSEFKKWIQVHHPDELENWEVHYVSSGGKIPKKDDKATK